MPTNRCLASGADAPSKHCRQQNSTDRVPFPLHTIHNPGTKKAPSVANFAVAGGECEARIEKSSALPTHETILIR